MKKISMRTLEEAIVQASKDFDCSVVDLNYEVIQAPSNGFLGFFKRDAIIVADCKKNQQVVQKNQKSDSLDSIESDECSLENKESSKQLDETDSEKKAKKVLHKDMNQKSTSSILDKKNIESDCIEIEREVKRLLSYMPYDLDCIEVRSYGKNIVEIYIDGKDAPLLIGEKGYRYKAFSYLLFSWIQPTYNYNVRLEVAQFLRLQEGIVEDYIQSIRHKIETNREFRTKNLSGVLGLIVARRLRELYPGRFVSLKEDNEDFYVLISDFK